MNLVSEIVEALGPTIVSRVASSLGFDQAVTQKAVIAVVPGLLAALISLVSKPQGASKSAFLGRQSWGFSHTSNVIGGWMRQGLPGSLPHRRTMSWPHCHRDFPDILMTPASFVTPPRLLRGPQLGRLINLPRRYGPGCLVH
jgi:hypothetical protein